MFSDLYFYVVTMAPVDTSVSADWFTQDKGLLLLLLLLLLLFINNYGSRLVQSVVHMSCCNRNAYSLHKWLEKMLGT